MEIDMDAEEKIKIALDACMDNENWIPFGLKIPHRGRFFNRFINQDKIKLENFLTRNLFAAAFVAVTRDDPRRYADYLWYNYWYKIYRGFRYDDVDDGGRDMTDILNEYYEDKSINNVFLIRYKREIDEYPDISIISAIARFGCILSAVVKYRRISSDT